MYDAMVVVFTFVIFLLIYSFLGYPLTLLVLGAVRGRRKKSYLQELPSVMFVFPCCWEGGKLQAKINNSWNLDYPRSKLEIVAVADGATLETMRVLRRAERKGMLRVLFNPKRSGKSASLIRALKECDADLFVVSDADALLEPCHLKELVAPFADPRVGAATGSIHYSNVGETGISKNEGIYWRFEMLTRNAESMLGRLIGVVGAIYAIRPKLFFLKDPRLDADFLAPLCVLEKGGRVLLLDRVSATDYSPTSSVSLFARRVRMINLGVLSLLRNARYLNPFRYPVLAWQIWTHKIARWLLPVWMILVFLSNAILIPSGLFWQILFGAQIVFYGAGLLGGLTSRYDFKIPILSSIWYFLVSVWASLIALFDVIRGKYHSVWGQTAGR